ncbi:MAG: SPOR domain-containing protein [Spirochaetaceae bacterium]|jgi:hypothetical protein|nr:SPOR domain-containing protein [Spirochaetaceae bacterium]
MGSINFRFPGIRFAAAALVFLSFQSFQSLHSIYPQESGSSLLTAEIETLRKTLHAPNVPASGRREAAIRLARFLTLSGNQEGAADAWFTAAEAGTRDDRLLLEGVRCLIALGQFDAAGEYVSRILLTGNNREVQAEARYLGAQIQAFRTGNGGVLNTFLMSAEYADKRPSTLYTLWRITGEDAYKTRLETDYPSSPEARISQDVSVRQVQSAPTAMWILFPGREGISLSEPSPAAGSPGSVAARPVPAPPAAGSVVLQTGLFSREENTAAMTERLKEAGFTALVTRRRINGTEYWAVGVPPGENMNDTTLALKNAGFESFPVY